MHVIIITMLLLVCAEQVFSLENLKSVLDLMVVQCSVSAVEYIFVAKSGLKI